VIEQPRHNPFIQPDIIIDEAGQTWVLLKSTNTTLWHYPYMKIEELRAESNDCSRGTRPNPRGRSGRFRSADPYRFTRRGSYFDESGYTFPRPDPVANGVTIHQWLEDWFKNNGPA